MSLRSPVQHFNWKLSYYSHFSLLTSSSFLTSFPVASFLSLHYFQIASGQLCTFQDTRPLVRVSWRILSQLSDTCWSEGWRVFSTGTPPWFGSGLSLELTVQGQFLRRCCRPLAFQKQARYWTEPKFPFTVMFNPRQMARDLFVEIQIQ